MKPFKNYKKFKPLLDELEQQYLDRHRYPELPKKIAKGKGSSTSDNTEYITSSLDNNLKSW